MLSQAWISKIKAVGSWYLVLHLICKKIIVSWKWWYTCLIQYLGGWGRQISIRLRPAWSIYDFWCQARQGYIVKLCLENKKINKKNFIAIFCNVCSLKKFVCTLFLCILTQFRYQGNTLILWRITLENNLDTIKTKTSKIVSLEEGYKSTYPFAI